ncbi:MAG: hypothetical protein IPP40_14330, partial [bacterium]|nr:hypothetical protein [bacterium]
MIRIYAEPSDGDPLWQETFGDLLIVGGHFNCLLDSFLSPVFDLPVLYLGVSVAGDQEMVPRQQIVSAPFSHRVGTVHGATGGTITSNVRILGSTNFGWGNVVGDSSFVMGVQDTAAGPFGAVLGGKNNAALDSFCVVTGGEFNKA